MVQVSNEEVISSFSFRGRRTTAQKMKFYPLQTHDNNEITFNFILKLQNKINFFINVLKTEGSDEISRLMNKKKIIHPQKTPLGEKSAVRY